MAALNQDLVKYEHDSWQLIYTVTDSTTTLYSYKAWWGLSSDSTPTPSSGLLIQSFSSATWVVTQNADGCSSPATDLNTETTDSIVTVTAYQIKIPLPYSVFADVADGDYYHELVLIPIVSGQTYQCRSVVAATGILTVKGSMFTNYIYR